MESSARTNISFFVPVAVGLGVFAAIALTGNGGDLSWERFGVACLAFLAIAPVGAWELRRLLEK
ncbi:hypothetical protein ACIQMV_08630 [Streptomyces sp. NPDC091412]|uniref:hypothetical protein n=1 Tax=Streptomyces sp. NPDC091412 TaxID=3366002 RepID=UPI00381D1FF9